MLNDAETHNDPGPGGGFTFFIFTLGFIRHQFDHFPLAQHLFLEAGYGAQQLLASHL